MRKVEEPAKVEQETPAEVKPEKGSVTFIKNQVNEKITLPNGQTFRFPDSTFTTADKELIKGLKSVADKHKIFIK